MNNILQKKRPQSRTPRRWHVLFTVLVVLTLVAGLSGRYYRYHFIWKYMEWHGDLYDIKAVPNSPMPDGVVPEDWTEHSLGCMTFRLPPELMPQKTNHTDMVAFQDEHRKIVILCDPIGEGFVELLDLASQLNPAPTTVPLTVPRLHLECFSTGADEFRWSRTPKDVQWHTFCIGLRQLIDPNKAVFTESFFRKDLDGILLFSEKNVCLVWQRTSSMDGGFIWFIAKDGELDSNWVRNVSRSINIKSGPECVPPAKNPEQ